MKLIFRIEDRNRSGPYQGHRWESDSIKRKIKTSLSKTLCKSHGDSDIYPPVWLYDNERSAFDSLYRLRLWFMPHLERLHRNGFRVAVYEVADLDIIKHHRQVVAKIANKKPIKTFPITKLDEIISQGIYVSHE